jgi:hypothetical protein
MLGNSIEHLAARNAAANSLGVCGKRRNSLVPAFGQLPGPHCLQLGSLFGICLGVVGEFLFPLLAGVFAAGANAVGKMLPHFVWH